MSDNIITEFPVTLYGNLEKFSETISRARCRIFYKYGNRNGTYITDEFAEKLISSLPYTPVKGIYEEEDGDYTDHGKARSAGRIYGIVPENPNFAWEKHLDEDGVERIYACVDVLVFTALYTEASSIVGKSQSMELYQPSLRGEWKVLQGKRYYVFSDGCFLGLQILGDNVEPCFEGAAFFSLYEDLKKMVAQIEKYNLNLHNGGSKMLNYKLSDGAKFHALWSLLNVNYCEEGNWSIEYDIVEVYDDYAIVKNYVEGIFERVYYIKDDETDSVELGERERCYFVDVTESEKIALETIQKLNGNTYEKIDENYAAVQTSLEETKNELETANNALAAKSEELTTATETYEADKANFETKIEELGGQIATLTTERDEANASLTEAQTTLSTLNEQIDALNSFKADVEKKEKQGVIAKYSELLSDEVISAYTAKIDEYTALNLDKDLAYELVRTNQTVFTQNPQFGGYIPKDEPETGLESILSKYRK